MSGTDFSRLRDIYDSLTDTEKAQVRESSFLYASGMDATISGILANLKEAYNRFTEFEAFVQANVADFGGGGSQQVVDGQAIRARIRTDIANLNAAIQAAAIGVPIP